MSGKLEPTGRIAVQRYKHLSRNRWLDTKPVELTPWFYNEEEDKNGKNLKSRYELDVFFGKAHRDYHIPIVISESDPNIRN